MTVIDTDKDDEEGGMSKAGKAVLWLFIILILIPLLLVLALYLVARYYPKSRAGQNVLHRYEMFKEMMAKRKERKLRLAEERALENIKKRSDSMNGLASPPPSSTSKKIAMTAPS